jgi:hypothetical protein
MSESGSSNNTLGTTITWHPIERGQGGGGGY